MSNSNIPSSDKKFETYTLKDIKYYDGDEPELYCAASINFEEGMGFGVGHEDWPKDFKPAPGSKVKLYGKGIGYTIRGVVIDNRVIYYRTEEEEEQRHKDLVAQQKRDRQTQFEKEIAQHDARFNALPEAFQRRIERFRASRPDWRWEFEPYEVFCCQEAVKITLAAQHAAAITPQAHSPISWIRMFADAPHAEQKRLCPELKFDEHSGNTFGFACRLALDYVTDPELLMKEHGALVMLVGCEEYGCHKKESK